MGTKWELNFFLAFVILREWQWRGGRGQERKGKRSSTPHWGLQYLVFYFVSFLSFPIYKDNCFTTSLQKEIINFVSFNSLLITKQQKGLRFGEFNSQSDPIFKELELLKLFDIRQLELGKLMFSFNHSVLPTKFNDYFSLNKQVHNYATRYANDFHLPFCRSNLRKFSVSFQGPTYYNSFERNAICSAVFEIK